MPKFSASFKQRVIAPAKYFSIDNGLRRANSPQLQPDLGHRLENAVALHLRRNLREDGVEIEVVPAWQWMTR